MFEWDCFTIGTQITFLFCLYFGAIKDDAYRVTQRMSSDMLVAHLWQNTKVI